MDAVSATSVRSDDEALVRRCWGAAVAVAAAALLGVASWLTPAEAGLGTHEQLNMPSCLWIGMADMPCPSCGMTTAFAHAADGHLLASFLTQPLGFLLALGTAMALLLGSFVAVTAAPVHRPLAGLVRPRTGWLVLAMALAAWGYKVLSYRGYN